MRNSIIIAAVLALAVCGCVRTQRDVQNVETVSSAGAAVVRVVAPVVRHVEKRAAKAKRVIVQVKRQAIAAEQVIVHAFTPSPVITEAMIPTASNAPAKSKPPEARKAPWKARAAALALLAGLLFAVAAVLQRRRR
ncbi:MAG: hypothetical protein ACREEN_00985 [Stellaceae bacterium]